MRIGDLNRRVTLQYKTKLPDGMGGSVDVFIDAATVFAAIWPVSASEQIQAAQQVMTISHRIRIRYRSVFKSSWRVKFGTRFFSIVSIINPNEAGKYLDIMCKEAA